MIDLNKLGKPETAVAAFVTLLADLCALDEDKMACYLDCYYQLRKYAEKEVTLEPVVLQIRPTAEPEDLREAASAFAAEPSPAEGIIRACADPVPGPVDQEPEPPDRAPEPPKGFVPVKPNPLRGGASAKFKRETRERLAALRSEQKLSLKAVADVSDGTLTLSDLLSILECQKVDLNLYIALAQTLNELTK